MTSGRCYATGVPCCTGGRTVPRNNPTPWPDTSRVCRRLPHHADADAVPAHAALDAVTVAGRGVADLHQVAVVVDRVVAVVDVSVAVQVEVSAGRRPDQVARTVGELRIVGPCLRPLRRLWNSPSHL